MNLRFRKFGGRLLTAGVLIWVLSGFYTLQSGQHAIVQRFGQVTDEVKNPGFHYRWPTPIEKEIKIQISKVETIALQLDGNSYLEYFTGDENLIAVRALVSYDINNLERYLFGNGDVNTLIQTLGRMLLNRELAGMTVDDSMTTGKSVVRLIMRDKMQQALDQLEAGVQILSVELTDITAPQSVVSSFQAVGNARVKKQEIIRDAEGYANAVLPKARGESATLIAKAEAEALELTHRAKAGVQAFNQLLKEYDNNPELVKGHLYRDTVQTLIKRAKVKVDADPNRSTYQIYSEDGFLKASEVFSTGTSLNPKERTDTNAADALVRSQ